MESRFEIAEVLAAAAREMNAPRDLAEVLDAIVHAARLTLPDVDHVGISVASRRGGIETKAATDPLVWELDQLQYEVGEGPCLYAIDAGRIVKVDYARHEQRWPKFIPLAVQRGLKAQLGVQLYADGDTLGGLNMYSVEQESISDESVHLAELFATHAALALGNAREEDNLNAAMVTRKVIGQAIGIVTERFDLTEEQAFAYLARLSQTSNIKLHDLAVELVADRNDRSRHAHDAATSAAD